MAPTSHRRNPRALGDAKGTLARSYQLKKIMRLEAKRLTKKETLQLLEYAYLAGEKTGQENAKNIYWHAREKVKPSEAFKGWKKEMSKNCRFLA